MDLIMMVVSVIVLMIVAIIAALATLRLDLMNYTVFGVKSLKTTGNTAGNALITYSPGVTGAAKDAAMKIASNLKTNGFNVDLAGVRSASGINISRYDVVIAGGPMYFGKVSSSIETYLKTLKLPDDKKLGVFTTTGSAEFNKEDMQSLSKQVASLQSDFSKSVTKTLRSGDAMYKDCEDIVFDLLKSK